ncbi:MAG: hypothetical protein LBQ92_03580 [Propionibacteriaceae bacterium]|jgi:hypothetical protein|nr:hypothetical protein [Propionibacteriaceae bacterium]
MTTVRRDSRLTVETWLATKIVFVAVAAFVMLTQGRSLGEILANWDAVHFTAIAERGYFNELGQVDTSQLAFFPGWPLLLRCAGWLGLPLVETGAVLALILSGAAACALYRMYGSTAAIAWMLAPMAVFTVVPYTESLFCAAAFWAWERANAKQWWSAGLLAAVAMSARVSGLFLIGALAILAFTQGGKALAKLARLPWLLLPTAVLGVYVWYMYLLTGTWTAWFSAQTANWSREFTWPWVSLQHTLEAANPAYFPDYPENSWVFAMEVVAMALGLGVAIVCLIRKRWAESAWVAVQVLAFSISYWFMSSVRAVLLWFPLYNEIGMLARRADPAAAFGRIVRAVVVGAALVFQVFWAWTFFSGRWAG